MIGSKALKECPLCGGNGVEYYLDTEKYIVQCENCGLTTPETDLEYPVVRMWNSRIRLKTWAKAVLMWEPVPVTPLPVRVGKKKRETELPIYEEGGGGGE